MFAVIQVGSQQYKVKEGDVIEVNRLKEEEGKALALDKVLLFAKDSDIRVGNPYLKDVQVKAKVEGSLLGEKLIAYKFRRRKEFKKTTGHRQKLTAVRIEKIEAK